MVTYTCEECGASFPKLNQRLQHRRTENHWKKFMCPSCKKVFNRKDNLDRHKLKHKNGSNQHCPECLKVFTRNDALEEHLHREHGRPIIKRHAGNQERGESSKKRKLETNADPRRFYSITKIKEQRIPKFRTTGSTFRVSFKDIEVADDVLATIKRMFASIIGNLTKGTKSADLVRMTVQTPSLDYPIVIPFVRVAELTVDHCMVKLERVLQSNEDFVIDESLLFEITLVDMPNGGIGKRCRFVNTDKFLVDKRCIIRIQNDDDLCCARAIVTAKAKLDDHEKWNSIRTGKSLQEQLARELHQMADVTAGKCGIDDIKKFQTVLNGYQINVLSKEHFNSIIYSGPEADKKMYLYYHDHHYDIITSMAAFLGRSYFCSQCNKGYDHKERHTYHSICHNCHKVHDLCEDPWIECDNCNRFFQGERCFELHKSMTDYGNSTCKSIYRCTGCGKTVNKKLDKKHKCGQIYCRVCKGFFDEGHLCYMKPEEEEQETEDMSIEEQVIDETEHGKKFIFFDFECTQETLIECDSGYKPDVFGKCKECFKSSCDSYEHVPNLCVAQKACTVCMDKMERCEECGEREYVFKGENTLNDSCKWLFSDDNYDSNVLYHYFLGYDSFPILKYLYTHSILPKVVPNGAKVMCISVQSCKSK